MPKKGGSIRKSNRTRKVRKGGTKRGGGNNIKYATLANLGPSTGKYKNNGKPKIYWSWLPNNCSIKDNKQSYHFGRFRLCPP